MQLCVWVRTEPTMSSWIWAEGQTLVKVQVLVLWNMGRVSWMLGGRRNDRAWSDTRISSSKRRNIKVKRDAKKRSNVRSRTDARVRSGARERSKARSRRDARVRRDARLRRDTRERRKSRMFFLLRGAMDADLLKILSLWLRKGQVAPSDGRVVELWIKKVQEKVKNEAKTGHW